jgi:Nucleotidyl transferase of unknown function (DUF2204)
MMQNDWFEPAYLELLKELEKVGAEYMVIGGYAVGFHGILRATKDLDIWINPTKENAQRMVLAARGLGYNDPSITTEVFINPNFNLELGEHPAIVEMLKRISGVSFDACYARRHVVVLNDVSISFISKADLMENKIHSRRWKDMDDFLKLKGKSDLPPTQ